jgi:hypothetical protein
VNPFDASDAIDAGPAPTAAGAVSGVADSTQELIDGGAAPQDGPADAPTLEAATDAGAAPNAPASLEEEQ